MPDLLLTLAIIPFAGGFESTSAEAGALFMSALRSKDDVEFASTEAAPVADAGLPRLSTFDSGRLPSDVDPACSWPEGTCKPLACACCWCCSCSGLSSDPCSSSSSSSSAGIEDVVIYVLSVLDRRTVRSLVGTRSMSSSSGSEGASTNSSFSSSSMTSLLWSEARGTCKAGGVAAVASAAPLAPLASSSCAPSSSSA